MKLNLQKSDKTAGNTATFETVEEYIISTCKVENMYARKLQDLLENVRLKRQHITNITGGRGAYRGKSITQWYKDLHDEYNHFLEKLHKKYLTNQVYVKNITTTVGRAVIAQRLGGDNTYSLNISHTALGDNNTTPVVGDTTLGNETYRKALSSGTDSSTQVFIETFYTASEVSGTFEEYGHFIDGSASADSGQLFNRFTTTVTKSATETLNVQSIITVNDA